MPASPANVSGRAPATSARRRISARPRETSAAFALSPSPSPSAPPAASAMTFFAAAQSSTPTEVLAHVDAEDRGVDRELEAHPELEVLARDHRGRGQAADDLLGDVRAGKDGDRPAADERRQPLAGRGIEALRQAQDRRRARKRGHDLAEDAARDGDDDELRVGDRRVLDGCRRDATQVGLGDVARIPARLADRGGLLGVPRRRA